MLNETKLKSNKVQAKRVACLKERNLRRYKTFMLPELEKIVCWYYEIDGEILRTKSRSAEKVLPRQVFIYLAYELKYGFKSLIAKHIGVTHATIIWNIGSVGAEIEYNKRLRDEVEDIKEMVLQKELELIEVNL